MSYVTDLRRALTGLSRAERERLTARVRAGAELCCRSSAYLFADGRRWSLAALATSETLPDSVGDDWPIEWEAATVRLCRASGSLLAKCRDNRGRGVSRYFAALAALKPYQIRQVILGDAP